LMEALGSDTAVSCEVPIHHPPSESEPPTPPGLPQPHTLPPQFFFTAPALLYIQNYLQALVIAAALRALTRLPPAAPSDFMTRVWALLKAEIDQDEYAVGVANPGLKAEGEQDATRLVNLADEVVRARRLVVENGGVGGEGELRAAVERTLKPQDPVIKLLLGRLVRVIGERVGEVCTATGDVGRHGVPERMRTGRNVKGVVNGFVSDVRSERMVGKLIAVKGFEDLVLVTGIEDAVGKILQCIEWVDGVWGDLI
jgi:hypothetical protein